MSYEGCVQMICDKGHLLTVDAYDPKVYWNNEPPTCDICGARIIWENCVDYTNGSFDDAGNRIDGWIDLKPCFVEQCEHCNSILETRYEVPKTGGRRIG